MYKKAPYVTGDGQLVDASEVHFNQETGAPQVFGTMRFEHTSDSLRGLIRDLGERARAEHRSLESFMDISGRSGHSRIGIDVHFAGDQVFVSDHDRSVEMQIVVTALNPDLSESLADLRDLSRQQPVDIGRLFIPMSDPLSGTEIEEAVRNTQILMPEKYTIEDNGIIEIPLDNIRYVLSSRLARIKRNFIEMILRGKHGLNLFQQKSPSGLPASINPRQFLVSSFRISLGPYMAFIQRKLNRPGVFHLASRLLDGIKTTGINVPRHVEIFNGGDHQVDIGKLRIRLNLYPAERRVAQIAERILRPDTAAAILRRGVDFAELSDIFEPETAGVLFDDLTASPGDGGIYGRLIMPGLLVNIPWEHGSGHWIPEFQWRLVYEAVRGNLLQGVLREEEIPRRFRLFMDDLKYVGGEQNLSKVFVSKTLPPPDTLRVLKRNGIGVVLVRGLACGTSENGEYKPDFYHDQSTYEELVSLEREGMRFYMAMAQNGSSQVREFYKGLWVTAKGKKNIDRIHTTIAVFGSAQDQLQEVLVPQFYEFLKELKKDERLGDEFAVAHGSGPGVMKAIDQAAADLDVLRIGVGIDAEKLGQAPNLEPDGLVQFVSLALNTRQDILDRRSIFKIFNIGGYGTSYEMNMALTFVKIGHCLPAPYIFVDPFNIGPGDTHLWTQAVDQFKTISSPLRINGNDYPPLGPDWIPHCCHLVRSYQEGLKIIQSFMDDPCAYWERIGVGAEIVGRAVENLKALQMAVPPYIEMAVCDLKE